MSAPTLVLIVLAAGTFGLKAAGPLALGNRELPVRMQRVVDVLPAALLAALALVSTLGDGRALTVDARLVGLVAAGLALWRRAPFVVAILVAAAATAAARAVG
ncbi:MAG: AzlD domain-containing protein [Ilumatobacter sp.]|nr:AzlD domain-containing protein [Ilumatobacter sp.]